MCACHTRVTEYLADEAVWVKRATVHVGIGVLILRQLDYLFIFLPSQKIIHNPNPIQ